MIPIKMGKVINRILTQEKKFKRSYKDIEYHPLRHVRRNILELSIDDVVNEGYFNKSLISRFERKELETKKKAVEKILNKYYNQCLLKMANNDINVETPNFEKYTEKQIEQYYAEQAEKLQNSGSDIPPLLEEKTEE